MLEVGGDWYDAFELPDGRIALTVGDVVGHGLAAAAAMGQVRTALAALADHAAGPGELLERLDGFLARSGTTDFATVCYAIIDPATGALEYASAGHPPMLVVSPAGETSWLDRAQSGPLCGGDATRSTPGIDRPRARVAARPLLGRARRAPQGTVRRRPRAARCRRPGRRGLPRRGGLPHAHGQARGRLLARRRRRGDGDAARGGAGVALSSSVPGARRRASRAPRVHEMLARWTSGRTTSAADAPPRGRRGVREFDRARLPRHRARRRRGRHDARARATDSSSRSATPAASSRPSNGKTAAAGPRSCGG